MSTSKTIRAGIAGGAGYTGGELIRLLLLHPNVKLSFVQSSSNAGKYIYEVHTDLLGDTDLKFIKNISSDIDVLFLCKGHGESEKFLLENTLSSSIAVIDLSQDFRWNENKSAGRNFIYGLPEFQRDKIKNAKNIANPGCFATGIQLALLPLAKGGLLQQDIHITATTGSTGAGQALVPTTGFNWRNNNLSIYKAFEHQHLYEIGKTISQLHPDFGSSVHFVPQRGNFTRGILSAVYMRANPAMGDANKLYREFYAAHPFVHISDNAIDLKQVINTNKCLLHIAKHGNMLLITSVIDNLLKGAAGQALQNMNLMFNLDETSGLLLKSVAF